jgi:hypothetical protein
MEKFTGDWSKRLPKEEGTNIIDNAKRLGEGTHEKDCYWSGYEKDGRYFIALNDDNECVWESSFEDMESHCLMGD